MTGNCVELFLIIFILFYFLKIWNLCFAPNILTDLWMENSFRIPGFGYKLGGILTVLWSYFEDSSCGCISLREHLFSYASVFHARRPMRNRSAWIECVWMSQPHASLLDTWKSSAVVIALFIVALYSIALLYYICIVLHCIACIVLYCIALYCNALYCMHCIALHGIALHCTVDRSDF